MPLLKDLVPGSMSDRLSFHSDTFSVSEDHQQEIMEEGVVPARPTRGFTPKGSTPSRPLESRGLTDPSRSRSRENYKSGASEKASETHERTMRFTCLLSLFSTIFNYLWTKLKRTFKEEVGVQKTLKRILK